MASDSSANPKRSPPASPANAAARALPVGDCEALNRALIRAIPDTVFVNRRNGEYLSIHAPDPALLVEPPDKVLHRKITDVLPDPVAARCLQAIAMALDTGQLQELTYALVVDGQERHFEARIAPCGADTALSIVRDITARKRAEEDKDQLETELRQSQKMESIGRLAGGIAHDFNNLLQAILGNVELALGQTPPDNPVHQDLLEVQGASLRAADLTHQLLAFARKQTIAPRLIDLNATVEGMLTMLHRLVGERVKIVWTPAADLWTVRMDPAQIDQVLANLCVNSRDAMGGNGEIQIETRNVHVDDLHASRHEGFTPGDYSLLMVSDNGCGMGKETQERIFEPFFTTKDMGRGTGLGLSTVYGIIRQNGGHIAVYSEPGKGTTFRIYLPRCRQARADAAPEPPARPLTRGTETLLLVEDELAILKLTTKSLEQQGYTVLAANAPADALLIAQTHSGRINLLLTDIVMPRMNGRELAERLKTLQPGLKCVFMSGYPANVIARQGILEDGVHFIQKPFSMADLDAKIRAALDS